MPPLSESEAMNERVCSALNPEVSPKYRRSLATASTQTEIASASSGVLERVVIIVVAKSALAANYIINRSFRRDNTRPEWRGAEFVKVQTGAAIPRPLQADGSVRSSRLAPHYVL